MRVTLNWASIMENHASTLDTINACGLNLIDIACMELVWSEDTGSTSLSYMVFLNVTMRQVRRSLPVWMESFLLSCYVFTGSYLRIASLIQIYSTPIHDLLKFMQR